MLICLQGEIEVVVTDVVRVVVDGLIEVVGTVVIGIVVFGGYWIVVTGTVDVGAEVATAIEVVGPVEGGGGASPPWSAEAPLSPPDGGFFTGLEGSTSSSPPAALRAGQPSEFLETRPPERI